MMVWQSTTYISSPFANLFAFEWLYIGDDTKHIKVPYYEAPTFVASYLPENKTEVVDVVFITFVQEILLDTLYKSTGKNYTVESYGNPNITSSTMWNKFAQDHWASNC